MITQSDPHAVAIEDIDMSNPSLFEQTVAPAYFERRARCRIDTPMIHCADYHDVFYTLDSQLVLQRGAAERIRKILDDQVLSAAWNNIFVMLHS